MPGKISEADLPLSFNEVLSIMTNKIDEGKKSSGGKHEKISVTKLQYASSAEPSPHENSKEHKNSAMNI